MVVGPVPEGGGAIGDIGIACWQMSIGGSKFQHHICRLKIIPWPLHMKSESRSKCFATCSTIIQYVFFKNSVKLPIHFSLKFRSFGGWFECLPHVSHLYEFVPGPRLKIIPWLLHMKSESRSKCFATCSTIIQYVFFKNSVKLPIHFSLKFRSFGGWFECLPHVSHLYGFAPGLNKRQKFKIRFPKSVF